MSGEAPRHELRKHGQISGARFDATWGVILGLKVRGRDYNTTAGTCIRDYIDVTDLVYAHVKAGPKKVGIQCWHGQRPSCPFQWFRDRAANGGDQFSSSRRIE
eukprot:TRINITY_DN39786_c0_g1_i1.p1 TRINITY_DN39786_c0_g1~~TRINITY_DN39786_c0_g1_i1.p1  ORF type:complete len:103 (+),score=17.39 TRINITY_DN39786_c0_g1_i1:1282-1590(+)